MAKGAGIIAVVWCHSMIPMRGDWFLESAVSFLASFAIVLFFILAGMTYNGDKHRQNLKNYATSRGRQLLIPYFSIYIIMTLLFIPLTGSVDTYLTPPELIFWLLYGSGPPGQPSYLWFLPVLYFGLLLFIVIESVTHSYDPRVRWPLVLLLPLVAFWITNSFAPLLVPWRVNSILIATTFCIIGHEMTRLRGLKPWRTGTNVLDGAILAVLLVFMLMASQYNGFISFADDWFGTNEWLFLVNATAGTIFIFMLSSSSKSSLLSRDMQFLGKSSQVIYEIHPVFFYLAPVLMMIFGWSLTAYDAAWIIFWPLRLLLGLGLSIPFAMLVPRSRILSLIFTGKSHSKTRSFTDTENSEG
ncbi:MAG: acyltransferase family protein [Candidatus Thorarchaeota archaeon]